MRFMQLVVGFFFGAASMGAVELLLIALIVGMSDGRYEPSGIGWFIIPIVGGLSGARAGMEGVAEPPFSYWVIGSFAWLAAVLLYLWFMVTERTGEMLLTLALVAYVPMLLSVIGLVVHLRLRHQPAR
jgi:hypothetical protein